MKKPEKKFSRKNFFKSIVDGFASFVDEIMGDELDDFQKKFPDLIRPPGVVHEDNFLKLCIKCGKCIRACPFLALQPVIHANEFDRGTPCLRVGTSFCRFCEGFPCIEACPTGALTKDGNCKKIATAEAIKEKCLRSNGIDCTACEQICARTWKAISYNLHNQPPTINNRICTGCGACITVCPVSPDPALKLRCG